MKGSRITGLLIAGITSAMLLSGCSAKSGLESLAGTVTATSKETVVSTSSDDGHLVTAKKFDTSLEAPTFTKDPSGTTNVAANGSVTLEAEASVNDGGTVTYQWYSNNVDSNGGGTIIDGATAATYSPDTTEGGTTYYYVVAINDHGDTINESTSNTHAVVVWANMYWQQNADNGGYQYLNHDDGSYPADTTMEIDGVSYTFNSDGFAVDPSTGDLIDITTGQPATAPAADASTSSSSNADGQDQQAEDTGDTGDAQQGTDQIVDTDGNGIDDAIDSMNASGQ